MAYSCLFILCIFLGLGRVPVQGEVRFVCPRPQSPSSSITQGPCGDGAFQKDFTESYTEVSPGPLTIHWEETVFHKGAPSRITLHGWGGTGQSCILLDHIPHNDAAKIGETPEDCKTNGYPIGRCSASATYVTINIPDVDCDQCYLQLMTVATDLYDPTTDGPCVSGADGNVNCTAYYSCANIRVRATEQSQGRGLDTCSSYQSNLGGRWPYVEREQYEARLGESSFSHGHARFDVDATNYLKYDIDLGNVITIPELDKIFIVLNNNNNKYPRLQNIPVTSQLLHGEVGAFDDTLKAFLRNGKLAVEISIGSTGTVIYRDIEQVGKIFESGIYREHGLQYSTMGWLTGTNFVGTDAPHPQAVYPVGQCAPDTLRYAATLVDKTGILRALVAYSVMGEYVYVEGNIVSMKGSARHIHFSTHGQALPPITFPGVHISRNHAQGTLYLPNGKPPDFVSSIIKIGSEHESMSALAYRAIKAVISDKRERHSALAAIGIQTDGNLNVTVTIVNKTGQRTVDANVYVKGPPPRDGSTNQLVIHVPRIAGNDVGGWIGQTVIRINDSSVPHCLRLGILTFEVDFFTQGDFVTSQFESIDDWICGGSRSAVCKICEFSAEGGPVDRGAQVIPPNGFGTFYLVSDDLLQYSITVKDLGPAESVTRAVIDRGNINIAVIERDQFLPSQQVHQAVTTNGEFTLSIWARAYLAMGELKLTIDTTSYPNGVISGRIPEIGDQIPVPPTTTLQPDPTTKRASTTIPEGTTAGQGSPRSGNQRTNNDGSTQILSSTLMVVSIIMALLQT